jgi:trans-2,3-dihydro-3-hydroxyanthranilate isomerase
MMTQVPPEFGATAEPARAAAALGLDAAELDQRFPVQEVSTGLWFLIVPVKRLDSMQRIRVNLAEYYRLLEPLRAKAILAFAPETVDPDCRLHVRVFCDYYDVPEDPATGSANGCLCAWLSRHRFLGAPEFAINTEQGVEMQRPSLLHLRATTAGDDITVQVGGRVVVAGRGEFDN